MCWAGTPNRYGRKRRQPERDGMIDSGDKRLSFAHPAPGSLKSPKQRRTDSDSNAKLPMG